MGVKVHERSSIVRLAESQFVLKSFELEDVEYVEAVKALSQYMVNILHSNYETVVNHYQADLQKTFDEISAEYNLTLGEKIQILSSVIASNAKYIIRWERHGNYEKNGDEA